MSAKPFKILGIQQIAIGQGAIAALDLERLAGVEHELGAFRIGQDLVTAPGRGTQRPGEMLVLARFQEAAPTVVNEG